MHIQLGGEDEGILGLLVSVIGLFVDEEWDKLQVDVNRSPWSVMFNKGGVVIALVLQREITSVMVGGDVIETGVVERGLRVLEIASVVNLTLFWGWSVMSETESQVASSVTSTMGWHESSRVRSRWTPMEESEHSMEVSESKVTSTSTG